MFLRLLLVVALLLTACSSAPEVVELASPEAGADAPVETVAPTTQAPEPRPQKKSPAKTQPVTTTTATAVVAPATRLDPATAVLRGVVIDGGDSSGFESEHYGYGPIDPQTDCDPFNLFESRYEYDGSARYQSLGDVSLNHVVYDAGDTAKQLRVAAGQVAGDCPRMLWLEGGKALNEVVDVELPDGWVGFRQKDVGSDVRIWKVAAARDNLLSVFTYMTWGEAYPTEADSLAELVALADEALASATSRRPEFSGTTSTTTTTPGTRPTTTAAPPAKTSTILPSTTTSTTVPLPLDLGTVERYVLDEADLGRPVEIEEESIGPEEFEDCSNAAAFAAFFGQIEFAVGSSENDLRSVIFQMIGPIDQPAETAVAMREIEELITCSLDEGSVEFERPSELPEGIVDAAMMSVDEIDTFGGPILRFELLFVQVDDAIMYIAMGEDSGFSAAEMLELIADKASA